MTHVRTKTGGWAVNEKLTSAQANDLDIKTESSLDKTGDSLAGVILGSGAGRLVDVAVDLADADATIQPGTARSFRAHSGITADRAVTLGTTSVQDGDKVTVYCMSDFAHRIDVKVGVAITWSVGVVDATALSMSVTFVYDAGAWQFYDSSRAPGVRVVRITADGNWTVPKNIRGARVRGCGGGGSGGGGGTGGGATLPAGARGGGGGGGSPAQARRVVLVPDTVIACTIGAGGGAVTAGFSGTNGDNSVFDTGGVGPGPITFYGAGKGRGNSSYDAIDTPSKQCLGGVPLATNPYVVTAGDTVTAGTHINLMPGEGGGGGPSDFSGSGAEAGVGVPNDGYAGGTTGGPAGASDGTSIGGGSGGGGGAGGFGAGGAGGAGGGGHSASVGASGGAGTAAAANTGAGGGGGGAGGDGNTAGAGGAGGHSGAGGSGCIEIEWW